MTGMRIVRFVFFLMYSRRSLIHSPGPGGHLHLRLECGGPPPQVRVLGQAQVVRVTQHPIIL